MVEPVSISIMAIRGMVSAVMMSMGNEAGKRAYELLGGLVARVTGRQVPAPTAPAEWQALGRTLHEAARRDAAHARSLAAVLELVGTSLPLPGATRVAPPPLPPGVRSFTDRKEAMRGLSREASRRADGRPRRALVYGPEGIGTSALAVQWAREHARDFPDGALRVDVRGARAGHGRDPALALRTLLNGLGEADEDLPPALDARAELYQRLTEDRRMVVILDHVQSAAQVEPLLSGGPGVFTIVVAPRLLARVDAAPVPVGPLTDRDATLLLKARAGKAALARAADHLPALLDRCAGFPYALHAAAGTLHDLAAQDPRTALGLAPDPGPATPPGRHPQPSTRTHHARNEPDGEPAAMPDDPTHTAAQDGYARLPEDAARCYRLWALRPWPALTAPLAAALADITEAEAARLLAVLAERHLLEGAPGAPGAEGGAYRYRDGVRRHAEAAAAREDGLAACGRAVLRGVDHVLDRAVRADLAALPDRWRLGPRYEAAREESGHYPDLGSALAALVAELGNLVEAARAAEEFEEWGSVAELGEASWAAQMKAGRHDEVLPLLRIATRVARERLPGTRMAGRLHAQFGLALMELREFDEAQDALRQATLADRAAGHLRGQATAVESLGLLRLRQWRFQEARACFDEADALWDGVRPGDDGFADLARARALLHRHRGRALRGEGDIAASLAQSHTALASFQSLGDTYNAARTQTDLAETHLAVGDAGAALPLVDEALEVLQAQRADPHVAHLRGLRAQCAGGGLSPQE